MWLNTTLQPKILECFQKLLLLSFAEEKSMSYTVSNLKAEQEIRSRKELQSLSPKQQATSPESVCNGSDTAKGTRSVVDCSS